MAEGGSEASEVGLGYRVRRAMAVERLAYRPSTVGLRVSGLELLRGPDQRMDREG